MRREPVNRIKSDPSPTSTAAPCTVAAVMVSIKAKYNVGDTHATVTGNGGLLCASGIAKISVLIGPVNPPAGGPQGSPHLVLLEDQSGQWVIANDKLCDSAGKPTRTIPAKLGTVCGVQ